jgi:hypothetical protein
MDDERKEAEKAALKELCDHVEFNLLRQEIRLNGFPLPDGWQPTETTLKYEIIVGYPQVPPVPKIPADVTYHGVLTDSIIDSSDHNWNTVCIHNMEMADWWRPERHTLVTLTRIVTQVMRHPLLENPWKQQA